MKTYTIQIIANASVGKVKGEKKDLSFVLKIC